MKKIKTLVTVWRPSEASSVDVPTDRELRAAVPPEVDLTFLEPGQTLFDHLAGVEVLYGPLPERDLPQANCLRWIQLNSTGADVMMYDAFAKSGIELSTLGGAITGTVAEHALALLLALARNLHLQRDLQRAKQWQVACGIELADLKLGLLGFGRIGRASAVRARAFGMEIVAVDSFPIEKPDCLDALWGVERLPDLLRRSNALVCSVPLTRYTRRLIGAEQLELMRRGSFVVNVGRGGVIDEEALVAALRSGRIAGAGLDVTEVEPLPAESPLWTEPNVLLTPHSAGFSTKLRAKKIGWFANNLARYIKGETVRGRVDFKRGF